MQCKYNQIIIKYIFSIYLKLSLKETNKNKLKMYITKPIMLFVGWRVHSALGLNNTVHCSSVISSSTYTWL